MMPFWGSVDHFMIAVESVLRQEDPNWRLTIVDDVYPDLSAGEWAKSIDDPRVTYIRNEENLRPSRNYNKSVGLAKSEFVTIMGCDDVMLPGYVGRVRQLIAEFPDADIIQPGVTVIDENGKPVEPLADRVKALYRFRGTGARQYRGEELAASLLRGFWPYFPSVTWRVSRVASGFRTDLDVTQDLAMMFQIATEGGSLVLDDEVVFAYRRHSASVSAVTGPDGSKFRQERTLFREAEETAKALGWPRAARAARNHLTSRLHALTELPGALAKQNKTGIRTLTRHVLGLPY
ncbi:glycosyltransferase [Salinibacterium sp. dk2585]|nr:glycosyltransferase [Salinibacterium sp. dk2585]TXK56124.1 glycosyltransferase [Salinibacterium sp. dk5596]